jgi:hypothetical protein
MLLCTQFLPCGIARQFFTGLGSLLFSQVKLCHLDSVFSKWSQCQKKSTKPAGEEVLPEPSMCANSSPALQEGLATISWKADNIA